MANPEKLMVALHKQQMESQTEINNELKELKEVAELQRTVLLQSQEQQKILAMQNQVLLEQVKQMTQMMQSQEDKMKTFIDRFPLPASEPERLLAIQRLKLAHPFEQPIDSVEKVVEAYCAQNTNNGLKVVVFDTIGEKNMFDILIRVHNPATDKFRGRGLVQKYAQEPM